jgi:hypothetical protein
MHDIAERLPQNPIVTPDTPGYDRERLGTNINGPSPIRVPEWLPDPLGRYYLYFASHSGDHIRLAYADTVAGPWQVHPPGVLELADSGFWHHIASPDVHVDNAARQIRMYMHGPVPEEERIAGTHDYLLHPGYPWPNGGQMTRSALSADGLHFDMQPNIVGASYVRVFRHQSWHYAVVMPFGLQRSRDGLNDWELGPALFDGTVRHCALRKRGDRLDVYFSRRNDTPERLLVTTLDLAGDWQAWAPSEPVEVLRPEESWEGAELPLVSSRDGSANEPARQLRDPGILEDGGRCYLFYSCAGEAGIAVAELHTPPGPSK